MRAPKNLLRNFMRMLHRIDYQFNLGENNFKDSIVKDERTVDRAVVVPSNSNVFEIKFNVVHNCVRCDNCGVDPIVGIRYKCSVRDNYDLCENCRYLNKQPHLMYKIIGLE